MRAIIEPQGPPEPGAPQAPILARIGWFLVLAAAGTAATATVAYLLKAPLTLLG